MLHNIFIILISILTALRGPAEILQICEVRKAVCISSPYHFPDFYDWRERFVISPSPFFKTHSTKIWLLYPAYASNRLSLTPWIRHRHCKQFYIIAIWYFLNSSIYQGAVDYLQTKLQIIQKAVGAGSSSHRVIEPIYPGLRELIDVAEVTLFQIWH